MAGLVGGIPDFATFKRLVRKVPASTHLSMPSTLWSGLLENDAAMKYAIPGSLLVGGCLLFYSGYCLGARRPGRDSTSTPFAKQDPKSIDISCFTPGAELQTGALPKIHSSLSLQSAKSSDGSERGSPVGDVYRCALVVRKDCKMSRSKTIIHCCRAFLAEFKKLYKQKDRDLKEWEKDGMTLVVLRADSEEDLTTLKRRAGEVGVAGHIFCSKSTENPSKTVLALGPSKTTLIKELTQHLYRL